MKRRSTLIITNLWPLEPTTGPATAGPVVFVALAHCTGEAARDAPVRVVDRRAESLQTDNAGERDERDQQGVLDQVLPFVFAHETSDEILHVPSLSLTVFRRQGAHLPRRFARPARFELPAGRACRWQKATNSPHLSDWRMLPRRWR